MHCPKTQKRVMGTIFALACLGLPALGDTYRSPLAVAVSPDGERLYVSDRTAGCVVALDSASGAKVLEVSIDGEPNGLALSADGKTLYVAQRTVGSIALVDTTRGVITGTIPVGTWPVALAVARSNKRLYCCNRGNHTVSVVDLVAGREIQQIAVVRDPAFAAIAPDESRVVVANYMPRGAGTDRTLAAEVSILDATALQQVARVRLPPGSTMAGGVWASPGGKWAYVTHLLGRFDLPITQLEQGWVHTCALSIIDVPAGTRLVTLLLDDLTRGAADPWAVLGSDDGKTLWVSHRGVHEVSLVDIGRIHELLDGEVPAEIAALKDGDRENIWVRIKNDRSRMAELAEDLTALHIAGVIHRRRSGGKGPTGMALSPDGKTLFVTNYYAGTVSVLDADTATLRSAFAVGDQPAPDAARRGEVYFHDATRCFQSWHSCASCHLDGGRIDGLPWDFLRDGIDNAKDVISLVNLHHTSPHNRRATRPDPRYCLETGVAVSHQMVPEPADIDDLLAYLTSLAPEPNPNLSELADAAARGKALFEGKAGCASCHPAPWFTNRKMYDLGMPSPGDPDGRYDTPSLIEAYRTAPYFHDGRAVTLEEALTKHDPAHRHGRLKGLTPPEIHELIAYVLSL